MPGGIADISGGPKVTSPVIVGNRRFGSPEQAARWQQRENARAQAEAEARTADFDRLRLLGELNSLAALRMQQRIQAENDRRALFQQRLDLLRSRAAGYRIDPSALPNNLGQLGIRIGY